MQPRLTIHARPAASSTTTSSAVRPEGNEECDGSQPLGPILRRAFLVERRLLGAIDEPLEHAGSIAHAGDGSAGDCQIVLDYVELGELYLAREVWLVRIGYPDFPSLD